MKWVKILEVFAEGGSMKLSGLESPDGKMSYRVDTDEDYDDEDGPIHSDRMAKTWNGALKLMDQHQWTKLYPDKEVNSEFSMLIASAVLERENNINILERWQEALNMPLVNILNSSGGSNDISKL